MCGPKPTRIPLKLFEQFGQHSHWQAHEWQKQHKKTTKRQQQHELT